MVQKCSSCLCKSISKDPNIAVLEELVRFYRNSFVMLLEICSLKCLRPYHVENTSSRPITEVKQRRVVLVLGWVTAWEYTML